MALSLNGRILSRRYTLRGVRGVRGVRADVTIAEAPRRPRSKPMP